MPDWLDVMRGAESCQHCMTEFPDSAAVTVILRCFAADAAPTKSSERARVAARWERRNDMEGMAENGIFVGEGVTFRWTEEAGGWLALVMQTIEVCEVGRVGVELSLLEYTP